MDTPAHKDPIAMDKLRNRTLAVKIVKPTPKEEE